MKSIIYAIIQILTLLVSVQSFQFMSPQVFCNDCTINAITTYNVELTRKYASSLSDTAWNTQAVPAGSNITVRFPIEYTLSGSETCNSLTISGNSVSTFNCFVNITSKSITIMGAITTNMFIDTVNLNILNVQNPSPAITTSPFTAQIGIDTSSNDSLGVVSLQPGSFQSITVTFDPTTVNTTANMIITGVLGNGVSSNGTITVLFPNNLRWSQQISLTNTLPLSSSMQCSSLNTNLRYTLSCSGDTLSKTVTITNVFSSSLSAGSVISFTINGLFSPPTTQSLDTIIVTTLNNGYAVDQSSPKVTGLTAKPITLAIGSTSSLVINTALGLQFNFTLADTISKNDYIVIGFPENTNFTYQTYICPQLNFSTNFSYVSASGLLSMYQSTTSINRNSGLSISLTIRTFTCPSSARTYGPISLYIMNSNGYKMSGSNSITILPKTYSATMVTANTTINSQTSYTISFQMTDPISPTGYFIVRLPAQIINSGSIDIQITGTSIKSIPVSQFINSSTLKLSSLNLSSSNIPPQNISIKVNGVIQPSSVKNISSFIVQIYFSSSNDLVSQATTTSLITTTPGNIISSTVTPGSNVTAATNLYTFQVRIGNPLNSGSQVIITLPTTISLITGGICAVQSMTGICTVASTSITFNLTSSFTAGSTITLSYSRFINPSSTRPTSSFAIKTQNAASETVDILPSTIQLNVVMVSPSALVSVSLTRSSLQNRFSTSYTFFFTQRQIISQSTGIASFLFPSSIVVSGNITCSSGSTIQICTVSSNTINVQFTPIQQNDTIYNFTINGIQNPISLKPTTSISITTRTQDLLYQYSAISTGLEITNTIASPFTALAFQFTNQVLSEQTSLLLNFTMSDSPSYLYIQYAPSFLVTNATQISCASSAFVPICTLALNSATGLYQTKVISTSSIPTTLFTLNLSTLNNPSTIPTDYTWVSSYTSDDYLISQNKNTVQFSTICTFPCRLCNINTRTLCTGCYSTNVTNRIYLHQQQCLSTCPDGYVENNNTFVCQACVLPCLTCRVTKDYCVTCNTSSPFKYLNRTSTTSTCLSECINFMYPDTTQVPVVCVDCVSPCSTCTTRTSCSSCISGYYLYVTQCLTSCPINITILINTTCYNCSSSCATCQNSVSRCTSCSQTLSLFNNTCVASCPGNLISISNVCVSCSSSCLTCSVTATNCTSCFTNSSLPFFYNYSCLSLCPNFYYPDTFQVCLSCSLLNRGCKNCSSPTVCLSCDPGFVLLTGNCLSTVPDGYLNISGIAVPCQGECQTCSVTLTNCTSCRTLNLFDNHCITTCPTGTVALNRTCRACTYPCTQCINSTTKCTKCSLNSSLYFYNYSCIAPSSCPPTTYPENATSECTNCTQPCNLCNSSVICVNCINGYFYVNSSFTCQTTCPPFSVGVSRICMACISPCETCTQTTVKCLTCITNYYLNRPAFQCLTACPIGKIANQSIMQCVSCSTPCKTCINTTDTCLSCVLGTFLSNNLCVKICPDGQYGINGLCKDCQNNCTTCSSAVHCLSCSVPLALYSASCLQNCPGSHSIVSNDSVCIACTTVVTGCSNCSKYGQCYSCFSPLIYFNRICVNSCPQGYKYENQTCAIKNQTDITLDQSLQSFTFPIPFTILGCVLFIACCMSKLQNSNTYLIGLLYSLFGLVETGSFAYLIYSYYILGSSIYDKNSLYILFAVAGLIYFINLLSFIVQTVYLLNFDQRFKNWLNSQNKCPFTFATLLSLLINYKFKMILFSKLFKFYGMSAILEKLSRFRLFNIFSFFGILPEALALYVCFVSIVKYTFQKLIFHAFLDVIIIFMINILLAILIVWKPENFFHEDTEEGFAVNKVIKANGDDFSKQAILGHEQHVENQQYGPDSYLMLSKSPLADVSQISNQLSQSLSGNKKVKVYFSNNQQLASIGESSNPFRREKKKDTIQNIMNDNIFGDISQQNDQYSQKPASNKDLDDSIGGGSQNINQKQSPKSPRKHATIVIGGSPRQHLKTNNATDQEDVGKRISKREKQLDLLRKQLEEKQQLRKQKRKSRKKLKKSIDIDLDIKQPQYEAITIKDQTQKMLTQQDSNMKTMQEPKNINLHAENKQTNVQEDFRDPSPPKDTIGSWRQLRITEENRKLPVFNQNSQEVQMNTISLPQSQHQNEQEQQERQQNEISKKFVGEELPAESNIIGIEKDLQQLESKKIKERQESKNKYIEKVRKDHQYEFQDERSKDFQSSEIQNTSIQILRKKAEDDNSKSLNERQKDSNRTKNSLQRKELSYEEKFTKEIKDQDNDQDQNLNQILKEQSKYLFLQESSKDYDQRAGTRLNFKNNEKKNTDHEEQLEDSYHEDQKINQRPFTASRKNKIKNSQALLEILARSQRQKMNSRGAALHKIAYQEKSVGQRKNFRLTGIPQKTESRQGGSLDGEEQKNSRLYKAGLNQFQRQKQSQDQLNRKKTMNHPLKTLKKKTDEDLNDLSSSFNQIQNSRNKSFNVGQLRKFASKDVSSQNVDDLGLDYVDYKKNYEDLMNQRYQILPGSQRNSTQIGNFRGSSLPKPFLNNSPFRRSNFQKDSSQQIVTEGYGSDLQKYYKRQQRSVQKKQRERKDKGKSLAKQKSLEQTKRVKELERIYLSRK